MGEILLEESWHDLQGGTRGLPVLSLSEAPTVLHALQQS